MEVGALVSDDMTPQVGEIWSARFMDRRVRVMRVWSTGAVALKTVARIGDEWIPKRGGMSSNIKPENFIKAYRLLVKVKP